MPLPPTPPAAVLPAVLTSVAAAPGAGRRSVLGRLGGVLGTALGAARGRALWPGLVPATVWAEAAFPQRPILLQLPFGPGGIADLTARAVAQAMAGPLGQPLVVENKPGAGSIVASQAVASAAADGHTLLLLSNGHAVAPALFRKLPYDALRDFAPICALASFDLAVFVGAQSRLRTLGQLLDQARARPGTLTLGTITAGSTQHLAAEWLRHSAGIDVVLVPYKATPAVLGALRSGEIDAGIEVLGPWLAQLQGGVLRALAVTGAQRFTGLPELRDVPTVAQAGGGGLHDYMVSSWNGLAAPAHTPDAVLLRINRAANDALASPAVQQQLRGLGARPLGGTPTQLRSLLADDTARWAGVTRRAGITPQ
jgi:tripartite-type tricarboxylate transporter receptor subunit TctC